MDELIILPSQPHDANLPRQDLIYLDANNLYGWAMSQFLPTHGFRFLSQDEITALRLGDLSDDDEDLYYPTGLYNPLAPESLVIDRTMCSSTQHSVFTESAPQRKLTPNLRDKTSCSQS